MIYPLELNPLQHYYPSRRGPILGIVLHITAGLQGLPTGADRSAEKTIAYGQTTTRPASWHGIADTDSAIDSLPDHFTAFHVQGYNSRTLGLEMCKSDVTWGDEDPRWVGATLRNAAAWCAPRVARYGLPVRLASRAEVDAAIAAGRPFGFTFHSRLDPERRRDPGEDFPWPQFATYLTSEEDFLMALDDNEQRELLQRVRGLTDPAGIRDAVWGGANDKAGAPHHVVLADAAIRAGDASRKLDVVLGLLARDAEATARLEAAVAAALDRTATTATAADIAAELIRQLTNGA